MIYLKTYLSFLSMMDQGLSALTEGTSAPIQPILSILLGDLRAIITNSFRKVRRTFMFWSRTSYQPLRSVGHSIAYLCLGVLFLLVSFFLLCLPIPYSAFGLILIKIKKLSSKHK